MSAIGLRIAAVVLDTMMDSRQKRTVLISIFTICLALVFLSLSLLPILTCLLLQGSNDAQAPQATGKAESIVTISNSGFCWPTPGYTTITSPYGYRVHPITGKLKFHEGVDIGADGGSQILAAAAGKVTISKLSSSYGN